LFQTRSERYLGPHPRPGLLNNEFPFSAVTIARGFTRAYHAGVVDQYVDAATLPEDLIDGALPTLFVGDIQDDLSGTQ